MTLSRYADTPVLVVDDAPNMRRTVKSMLRMLGIRKVLEADDGDTAWDVLNDASVKLVVCDWHMPRFSGLELLKKVKDSRALRDIPFLIVTAEVEETRIIQAAETEIDGYLLKPFTSKNLESKISQIFYRIENPTPFDLRMRAGDALAEDGRYKEAMDEFAKALDAKPDSARARSAIGEMYMRMGNEAEAEKWMNESVRVNPQYLRGYENLARFHESRGQSGRAIQFYEAASKISPHNTKRQITLGKLYLDKGELVKADEAFRKAVESSDGNADLHTEIGEIYLAAGDATKAASSFRNSLNISESVHVYNRLGIALRRKGLYKEAVVEYERALRVDPDDEAIHYNMGRAYMEMGDYDKALFSLNEALRLDPEFAECRKLIAQIKDNIRNGIRAK